VKDEELIGHAIAVRERAYAPYSRFPVGAAVWTAEGELFLGANVENASFGLTICAERNAIAAAVSAGARRLAKIAVVSGPGASMCGACRQVLVEFAAEGMTVLLADATGKYRRACIEELLPGSFDPGDLPGHGAGS